MTLSPSGVSVVGDIAAANARMHPNSEAVVDGERRLTWKALHDRVIRLANALGDGLGLAPGDRASMLAENCLEYYEYFHATAAAGVIAAPLNQRLAPTELAAVVEQVEPRVSCARKRRFWPSSGRAAALPGGADRGDDRLGYERLLHPPAPAAPTGAPTRSRPPPSASREAQPVFPKESSSRTAPSRPAAHGPCCTRA